MESLLCLFEKVVARVLFRLEKCRGSISGCQPMRNVCECFIFYSISFSWPYCENGSQAAVHCEKPKTGTCP